MRYPAARFLYPKMQNSAMANKNTILLAIVVVAIPLLGGCYGQTGGTPNTTGTGSSVAINGFAFNPATLTVSVGTTVTWTNSDSTTHTITSDTGAFDSGNVPVGQTYTHTFGQAGTFSYHCSIHTNMKGTIIVQA